jgi:hypothetical protein
VTGAVGSGGAQLGWCSVPFGATFGISLLCTELACFLSSDTLWLSWCCCCLRPRSASTAGQLERIAKGCGKLLNKLNGQRMPGIGLLSWGFTTLVAACFGRALRLVSCLVSS